jgi:tetratricopeptide (TPR) repeat protein
MRLDKDMQAAYDGHRDIASKPFRAACYAPFTTLRFATNGDVTVCCRNYTYVLGNVRDESLQQMWTGKAIGRLRDAMKQYDLGQGCDFCSERIRNGQYANVLAVQAFDHLPLETRGGEWPLLMDFTLSNTCNLACVMCSGTQSSTIRARREKLPPLPAAYGDPFFEEIRPFLPHLVKAKFFGGEPFLVQENYRIWDMIIEDGLDLKCMVNTNGTQYNDRVRRVLDAIPFDITVSMDGLSAETAESIRVYSDIDRVKSNLTEMLAYTADRGTCLTIAFCLMRQNWHELGEMLAYAESLGVLVIMNTVVEPVDCSLYTLPLHDLETVINHLEDRADRYSTLALNGQTWCETLDGLRSLLETRRGTVPEASAPVAVIAESKRIEKAWSLIADDRFDEAYEFITQDTGETPSKEALVIQAHILRRTERLDEAEQVLDRALEQYPAATAIRNELAWLFIDRKEFERANQVAIQAAEGLDDVLERGLAPYVHDVLCVAASASGDHARALRAGAEAARLRPDDRFILMHFAYALGAAGRSTEAERLMRRLWPQPDDVVPAEALEASPDEAAEEIPDDALNDGSSEAVGSAAPAGADGSPS